MAEKKLCYVIMPFPKTRLRSEAEWTEVFTNVISPAVEGSGLNYECRRSEATTGNLIKAIVGSLYDANVVIADLTDRNPNVFYELGVRHAFRNRTILIAQKRDHIPSDLVGYASHVYRWKTSQDKKDFAKHVRALIKRINSEIDRADNPVADFLSDRSRSILQFEQQTNERMLTALSLELGTLEIVVNIFKEHADKGQKTPASVLSCPALDHLIATQYINNKNFAKEANVFRSLLMLLSLHGISSGTVDSLSSMAGHMRTSTDSLLAAMRSGDSIESLDLPEYNLKFTVQAADEAVLPGGTMPLP
jgi:hypothetical protein